VTEAVTGIDLVRAQLRVAAGAPLPWTQADLTQRGHAIECRVYAEDPDAGFLPQAGRLLLYREPAGPGIRVDAGVVEGGEVTVHYDPLLAKVIVHAEDRPAAIARMRTALRAFPVLGLRTNIPYLLRVLEHPRFVSGAIDTGFLERNAAALAATPAPALEALAVAAAATVAGAAAAAGAAARAPTAPAAQADPWGTLVGWKGLS
jgi:acetyl/propionyl-CoA carboxylase alpha subunit